MHLLPLVLCISTLVIECTAKASVVDLQPPMNNLTLIEKWELLEKKLKGAVNSLIKMALPNIMGVSGSLNMSSQCMKDSMLLIAGIKNIRPWALRIVDASGKMIDGLMDGSITAFGAYDECVNTIAPSDRFTEKGKVLFQGQYCTILMKPPLPPKTELQKSEEVLEELKNFSLRPTVLGEASKYAQIFHFLFFRFGICVPSGCSLEDLDKLVKLVSKNLAVEARASRCEVKQELEISNLIICVLFAFSFAACLLLIGTFLELYTLYYKGVFNSKAAKVLLAFSAVTNFKKLTNTDTSSGKLSCLNGIRFLSISWVVLGHTCFIVNFQVLKGLRYIASIPKDFAFQVIINGSVAVDTFFFIGGLLVCYITIKFVKHENRPFNIMMYMIHRLWRIIPVYVFVILFMFLGAQFGSGPIWHETMDHLVEDCYNNWWTNLLFINNFYNSDHMCLSQTWYIASDTQLYVAALLILLPLIRWPKVGITLGILGIMASMAYAGISTYINNFPPTLLAVYLDHNVVLNYCVKLFFKPFVHAGPYCIGLLSGYLLAMKPKLKIPTVVLVVGWSLAICLNMSVLYGTWEWNKSVEPTFLETMLYSSCNRVAWTLGVAWMIICCANGYGGVVNYILSWKCWVPLGRLTFPIYLIHPIIQNIIIGNIRTEYQYSHFMLVWFFFGHLCVSIGCAFVATMLIEAPFISLEKLLFFPVAKDMNSSVKGSNNLKGSIQVGKGGDIEIAASTINGDVLKKQDEANTDKPPSNRPMYRVRINMD